jgi:hypothetical protein
MDGSIPVREMRAKAAELERLTRELHAMAGRIPAVDRNTKRILAALAMVKLNLETVEE